MKHQQIHDWIASNNLNVIWEGDTRFKIGASDYLCIESKKGKLFDDDFNLIIASEEAENILIDFYCFYFGGKVYYSSVKSDKIQLNLFKNIGKAKELSGYPYLGIHGHYELCSGSRLYEDWCKKANFLDIKTIAIAEKHTLAGAIKFQQAAKKAELKSIIGETVTVKNTVFKDSFDYKVKLYVENETGWSNLLRINKKLNVDNLSGYVNEVDLLKFSKGLFCVFQADTMLDVNVVENFFSAGSFTKTFFQLDPVQYKAETRDIDCLKCLKFYLDNYQDIIPLILITDSYYLDKEDSSVRKILNFVGKGNFEYQSDDQYFKSLEDVMEQLTALFSTKGQEFAFNILEGALNCLIEVSEACNFQIKLGEIHLPKYEMTEDEKSKFKDNEELFWDVIQNGLEEKVVKKGLDVEKYLERIESEYSIIASGNFQDYFLILRDIINWSESNNILVGSGRGSVGGSIIAYLIGITKVDAIEYGLLFSRFLNSSRVGKKIKEDVVIFSDGSKELEYNLADLVEIKRNNIKLHIEAKDIVDGDEIVR